MELRKRIDLRKLMTYAYFVSFAVYLLVGLMPAAAIEYDIDATLEIPSIGLTSDVTKMRLNGRDLEAPDDIVGSFSNHTNKTLLVGHSTMVFNNLSKASLYDVVNYNDRVYVIKNLQVIQKEDISMNKVLSEAKTDTLVIMTCAGELIGDGDASHRLIITAEAI